LRFEIGSLADSSKTSWLMRSPIFLATMVCRRPTWSGRACLYGLRCWLATRRILPIARSAASLGRRAEVHGRCSAWT